MHINKRLVRWICLLLAVLVLNACSPYRSVRIPNKQISNYQKRVMQLSWGNGINNTYYLKEASIVGDSLIGNVYYSKYETYKGDDKLMIKLHLKPACQKPGTYPGRYGLPISAIDNIEVQELDPIMGAMRTLLIVAGAAALITAIVGIIIALTKESCPFVYSWNGTTFDFTGEIYSGAIFPALERDDYLPLPTLQPLGSEYQIKLANEMKEIQSTNLAELVVVDHPREVKVLLDKSGRCFSIGKPELPLAASSALQPDLLPLLCASDSLIYRGDAEAGPAQSNDTVYLTFTRPQAAKTANLVLRAKNSFWLDYTLRQFFTMFGDKYKTWYKHQDKNLQTEQKNWSLEQGIPLSVYLKTGATWKFVDYFNVVGPMAERDIVMPIQLPEDATGPVQLKLECGALFWEINSAGLDFSPQQPVQQQLVHLNLACDNKGKDITTLLSKSDKKYYVMPNVGDNALLQYPVPAMSPQYSRSVFFHSRGYYEVIRETAGAPDLAYLKEFRAPGRLGKFSRQQFLQASGQQN